ncbi:hypothetical protein B0T26DRAFT_442660 [Lasiosphaeria miniovina]|uniref:Uncharacterized protein n=1 Tax=Lasiosphaeria miniovina TaxID=1954250 RepID=A0AA40DLX2_9PEZI|nr:uncharacterized protein B0T26DRAFT_442660 [Lasiosphaeria miniovina]KAK0706071.1 hypothetical protein B0T26DRAFT_442660 [Lasiosphaeria miniovina]
MPLYPCCSLPIIREVQGNPLKSHAASPMPLYPFVTPLRRSSVPRPGWLNQCRSAARSVVEACLFCLPVLLGYRHDRRASIVCTRVSTRSEVLFRPTCRVKTACAIAIWKPGHSRITERRNDRLMGGFGGEMAANANSFQHFSFLRWLLCCYFVAIPFYTWLLRREMALLAPEHKYRPEKATPKSQTRVSAAAPSPQSHWGIWRAAPSPWGKSGTLPCMPAPAAISDARFVPLLWFCIFWLLLRCVISASLDG